MWKCLQSSPLILIGIPEEERADFIAGPEIDSLSTRQLQKAVDQRKQGARRGDGINMGLELGALLHHPSAINYKVTMGGLGVDEGNPIRSEDYTPISHLYAAGTEVSGLGLPTVLSCPVPVWRTAYTPVAMRRMQPMTTGLRNRLYLSLTRFFMGPGQLDRVPLFNTHANYTL